MMGANGKTPLALAASACWAALSAPSSAQSNQAIASNGGSTLEQVVVTAQKSATNLQSTPLSITAVDAAALDRSNITDFTELDGRIPGVTINSTGANSPSVNIRGVGFEGYQNDSAQPGVSFNENGVYIASSFSLNTAFLDVAQIEVLRGPQGTVLGQNSDGGALNMTTVSPRFGRYEADAELSYGSYNFLRSRLIVNVPVGDTLAIRAAVQQQSHDGWSEATKIAGRPHFALDDQDSLTGRVSVAWTPTSRLSVNAWIEHYTNIAHASGAKNILDPDPNPRRVSEDYAGFTKMNATIAAADAAYDFGWGKLKAITSYQNVLYKSPEDTDLLNYDDAIRLYGVHDRVPEYRRNPVAMTDELDLISAPGGRLSWIVGAFFLHQRSHQAFIEYQQTTPGLPLPVYLNPTQQQLGQVFGDQLSFESQDVEKHTSYAVYAQGVYQLTPRFDLTAGARYTWDKSTAAVATYYGAPVHLRTDFQALTGKVSLDYKLAADKFVYVTYSSGVKPGGTNLNPQATQIPEVFEHETVQEGEIGLKTQSFSRRLRVNIDAFYNDYKNLQLDSEDPIPYEGGITNVGRVHTYGVELEASALLPYRFRLDGDIASLGGRVDSHTRLIDPITAQRDNLLYGIFTPADLAARSTADVDVNGRTPGKLSPFSTSITLSREDPMPFGGKLESRIQGIYRASYYFRVFDNAVYDRVPDMHQFDVSFRYAPINPHWYAEFLVVNLTNSNSVNARVADNFGVGEIENIYVPPRQFIGRIGVRF